MFNVGSFFVLRTPTLSLQNLIEWSTQCKDTNDPWGVTSSFLQTWLAEPLVREALFLASPSLIESLPEKLEHKTHKKQIFALLRYMQRMAGRATPFGLFAGVAVGSLGETTTLQLASSSRAKRLTRMDAQQLAALFDFWSHDRELRHKLSFTPNQTLVKTLTHLWYQERVFSYEDHSCQYNQVSLARSEELDLLCDTAQHGASLRELVTSLVSPEITDEDAEDFVHTLLDSQLLVSNLEPSMTDPFALQTLCQQQVLAPEAQAQMQALADALSSLDTEGVGAPLSLYQTAEEVFSSLPITAKERYHVDLALAPTQLSLGRNVVEEVVRSAALLHDLALPGEDPLADFVAAFANRYEGQEVPLLEALDPECGIGFPPHAGETGGSPLLDEFVLQKTDKQTSRTQLLHTLLTQNTSLPTEIVLSDHDITQLRSHKPLPHSCCAQFRISAQNAQALEKGDFLLHLQGLHGPSATRINARFCASNPTLYRALQDLVAQEEAQAPDAIWAEIVHLHAGHLAGVITRSPLRRWEIPVQGRSSLPETQQIPLTDLRLSLRRGKLFLRSVTHNREVIPCYSNAYNLSLETFGLVSFLCHLGNRGAQHFTLWSWGDLKTADFLPRVRHGKTLFSLARWRLSHEELQSLCRSPDLRSTAQQLRQKRGFPRHTHWVEADNLLPVDWENPCSLEAILPLWKRCETGMLQECFPAWENELPEHNGARFVGEYVLPLLPTAQPEKTTYSPNKTIAELRQTQTASSLPIRIPRRFPPFSSWLYVKLYLSASNADVVLQRAIQPWVMSGNIERWFFIRYADPNWHLRIRAEGDPAWLWTNCRESLLQKLQPFLDSGVIYRLQFDTYERECERYGGDIGTLLSEALFQADSELVLSFLQEEPNSDTRWRFALLGMYHMLQDLGFSLPERADIARQCAATFAQEFGVDDAFRHQLSLRFRRERQHLLSCLSDNPWQQILQKRSSATTPIANALKEAEQQQKLPNTTIAMATSYLHMHVNRVLRSHARRQELVIYDFLHRIYESELAIARLQRVSHDREK